MLAIEGSDAVIVAIITAVPATIAAIAAWRNSARAAQTAQSVERELTPEPREEARPTVATMIEDIYNRIGNIEGYVRGHVLDDHAHPERAKRRGRE